MGRDVEQMRAQAIEWYVRLRDGDVSEWEAFSDWLGEDVRHAQAYDLVEASDTAIEALLPEIDFREAANDQEENYAAPASYARRWVIGGSLLAASVAAFMVVLPNVGTDRYEVRTAAGEQRTVMLDAGTRIVLNGGTTVQFDRKDPRFASLEHGEALFQVRHDEARPFTLHVGDNLVQDAGTIFNVVKDKRGIRVAVSEGRVVYNPGEQNIRLEAGQALLDRTGDGEISVAKEVPEAIGSWQRGRLVYTGAPLAQVADDIERSIGVRILVDPSIAARSYSGSIMLDGNGTTQRARLQHALDVVITVDERGWTLKPVHAVAR